MEESNLSKYLNFVMSTDKSILPKKEPSTGPRITEPKTDIFTLALEQKKQPKKGYDSDPSPLFPRNLFPRKTQLLPAGFH